MPKRERAQGRSLRARLDQPLFAIPIEENGQAVVYYFVDEADIKAVLRGDTIQAALDLAGAWSDLDWDDAQAKLDQIRRQSVPTPPITDL